ncbi:MAG: translocation/assembly module TamB domain-containing protein [Notoacmeibacter sp.]|nr:translocation/assembly module TamB domain-containing protein [Notoacmeibacter sp.]
MRILLLILMLLTGFPALAQDSAEQEKSAFLSWVEDKISTGNRRIEITGINGVLSSDATIARITVADREGVWLTLEDVAIVWTRSALLTGRLVINELKAARIEFARQPLPDTSLPSPESGAFALPELPVSVSIGKLEAPLVLLGQPAIGEAAQLSVAGSMQLADGSLDTRLDVTRKDGQGGQMALAAAFANDSRQLTLDLDLKEPEGGILANMLEIEGSPSIGLTVKGDAPLAAFRADIRLAAGAREALAGTVDLAETGRDLAVRADLAGPLGILVPENLRAFFGPETRFNLAGLAPGTGGFRLDALTISGGPLALDGSGEVLPDGFLRRLKLNGTLRAPDGAPVTLPVAGGDTKVQGATLALSYGDVADGQWTGRIDAEGFASPDFDASRLLVDMGGQVTALDDPSARSVTFSSRAVVSGIKARRADVERALGGRVTMDFNGTYAAARPLEIARLEIDGAALLARVAGTVDDGTFDGDIALKTESLAPFSGFAGRELAGRADVTAKGTFGLLTGAFNLALDGTAQDVTTGDRGLDGLLSGVTRLSGTLERSETGFAARGFRFGNPQAELAADGRFSSQDADFRLDGRLADLALLDPRLSGPLTLTGRLDGRNGVIATGLALSVPAGKLMGRSLTGLRLGLTGSTDNGDFAGNLEGEGMLAGERIALASGISYADSALALKNLAFSTRGTRLTGDLARNASGLFDGRLVIEAPDISHAATLALTEAKGAVDADVALTSAKDQGAAVDATVSGLTLGGLAVGKARIKATIAGLFNVPAVTADLTGSAIRAGGVDLAALAAKARATGDTTEFDGNATLANGANFTTEGTLAPVERGYAVTLNTFRLAKGADAAQLVAPASVTLAGGETRIDNFALKAGTGHIGAQGVLGDQSDLQLTLDRVPLRLANMVRPDLGLDGTLGGVVTLTGPSVNPDAGFTLRGQGITAAQLKAAGIASLTVSADGDTRGGRLAVNATLSNAQGLSASVTGTAPLGKGALDLDVVLQSFPLAVMNGAQPGGGYAGRISGTAKVTGSAGNPAIAFALDGKGVSATALDESGLPPLDIAASGDFAGKAVQLAALNVSGAGGLALEARGTVPLSGAGLIIDFTGQLPLSLADRLLADRAAQARGVLSVSGRATGALDNPQLSAMVSATGAEFIDPQSNLRLQRAALFASVNGDQVTIRSFTGALSTGGTVSASGSLSLAAGIPANLAISLDNARYSDGELVAATLSGKLALEGVLARDPVLSGRIRIERAELTVPESLSSAEDIAAVKHRSTPGDVLKTLSRALPRGETGRNGSAGPLLRLNVDVNAPARIFLRGRGLDAELGGTVSLTGPVSDISPSGGFRIIRGRLSILGQRITLDSGQVTLIGDLDPYVDFTATTPGTDIDVTIKVTGRVSDLDITFSSQPELPQDEVLSRLIFGRGITGLSPIQLAKLAAAAAELAGGGPSVLDQVREATGLDDLDIVTDQKGSTAAKAGRYVTDNVYLGVQAGSQGNSKVTIDLDVTKNLKARGSLGSEDAGVGLFFEKDY